MKKLIILFLLLITVSFSQTSKWTQTFTNASGTPITSGLLEVVPYANTYPTGALAMTHLGDGVWTVTAPDGEYKLYYDSTAVSKYPRFWIGENRLSAFIDSLQNEGWTANQITTFLSAIKVSGENKVSLSRIDSSDTAGEVIITDANGVPTYQTVSGDVELTTSGVTYIAEPNGYENEDINTANKDTISTVIKDIWFTSYPTGTSGHEWQISDLGYDVAGGLTFVWITDINTATEYQGFITTADVLDGVSEYQITVAGGLVYNVIADFKSTWASGGRVSAELGFKNKTYRQNAPMDYAKKEIESVNTALDTRVDVLEARQRTKAFGNLVDYSYASIYNLSNATTNTRIEATETAKQLGYVRTTKSTIINKVGGTTFISDEGYADISDIADNSTLTVGMLVRQFSEYGTYSGNVRVYLGLFDSGKNITAWRTTGYLVHALTDTAKMIYSPINIGTKGTGVYAKLVFATITDVSDTLVIEHGGHFIVEGNVAPRLYFNNTDLVTINSQWKNKNALFLGTSITYPTDGYAVWAKKLLGLSETGFVNLAASGATFVGGANSIITQVKNAIATYDSSNFDVIVIEGGTNDWNAAYALGPDSLYEMEDLTSVDTTKYYGAVRWCLETLQNTFSLSQIYLVTPIQNSYLIGDGYTEHLNTYRTASIDVADRLSVQVIDAYAESGITKHLETKGGAGRYLKDGIHPGLATETSSGLNGKLHLGKYISNKLK